MDSEVKFRLRRATPWRQSDEYLRHLKPVSKQRRPNCLSAQLQDRFNRLTKKVESKLRSWLWGKSSVLHVFNRRKALRYYRVRAFKLRCDGCLAMHQPSEMMWPTPPCLLRSPSKQRESKPNPALASHFLLGANSVHFNALMPRPSRYILM